MKRVKLVVGAMLVALVAQTVDAKPAKPKPKPHVAAAEKAPKHEPPARKKKREKTFKGLKGHAAKVLKAIIDKAKAINRRHFPYVWGGGHNTSFSGPYDCSGAVSAVLHAAGFLKSGPKVASEFEHFGHAGPGRVTIYACSTHVYMEICGHFFGTSSANQGGGAGFFDGSPTPGFVIRHVPLR
jgi:hypothetical protein